MANAPSLTPAITGAGLTAAPVGDDHAIHADMENTATTTNALLHALAGDPQALRRCGEDYAAASGGLLKGLVRHLDDEEDLIVPLILDRGEEALGVAHHG